MKRKRLASIMRNEGKAGFRNRGKKATPPDPSQNLHVAKGASVTVDEVRAYGLPGCVSCSGTGRTPRGVICSCATRRFMKAHPEIIVDRVGYSWWPATAKPAPEPAPEPFKVSDINAAVDKLRANEVPLAEALTPCGICGAEWVPFKGGDAGLVHNPGCPNDVPQLFGGEIAGTCSECGEVGPVSACPTCSMADGKKILVCVGEYPDRGWEERCRRAHVRREACGL